MFDVPITNIVFKDRKEIEGQIYVKLYVTSLKNDPHTSLSNCLVSQRVGR